MTRELRIFRSRPTSILFNLARYQRRKDEWEMLANTTAFKLPGEARSWTEQERWAWKEICEGRTPDRASHGVFYNRGFGEG